MSVRVVFLLSLLTLLSSPVWSGRFIVRDDLAVNLFDHGTYPVDGLVDGGPPQDGPPIDGPPSKRRGSWSAGSLADRRALQRAVVDLCTVCLPQDCPQCAESYEESKPQLWHEVSGDLWLNLEVTDDGTSVYVVNPIDSKMYALSRDPDTGRLEMVQTLDVVTDSGGVYNETYGHVTHGGLVASHDGEHVYVSTMGNVEPIVYVFKRDKGTSELAMVEIQYPNVTVTNTTVRSRYSNLAISDDDRYVFLTGGDPRSQLCFDSGLHYTQFERNVSHANGQPNLFNREDVPLTAPAFGVAAVGEVGNRNLYLGTPDVQVCDGETFETNARAVIQPFNRRSGGEYRRIPEAEVTFTSFCRSTDDNTQRDAKCGYALIRVSADRRFLYTVSLDYNNENSNRVHSFERNTGDGTLSALQTLDVTSQDTQAIEDAVVYPNYWLDNSNFEPKDSLDRPMVRDLCITDEYAFAALEAANAFGATVPLYYYQLIVYRRDRNTGALTWFQAVHHQNRISSLACWDRFVYATDAYGVRAYSFVENAPGNLTFTTPVGDYRVNEEVEPSTPTQALGDKPTSYAVSPSLPAGLSMDPHSGIITGTPTEPQDWRSYAVFARNSGGATTTLISIRVRDVEPTCAYSAAAYSFVQYDNVTIAAPTTNVGSLRYSVQEGTLLPSGVLLNPFTGALTGTALQTTEEMTVAIECKGSGGAGFDSFTVEIAPEAPRHLHYNEPVAVYTVGNSIRLNQPWYEGGTAASFAVSPPLPAGLTMAVSSGIIGGTPTTVTPETTYSVTATNPTGTSSPATLTLRVVASQSLSLTYTHLHQVYAVGESIPEDNRATLTPADTTARYTVSPGLPVGMSLQAVTGTISGTPESETPETGYRVTATTATGSISVTVFMSVKAPAPVSMAYPASSLELRVGVAMPTLTPSNNGGDVQAYTLIPDTLPNGITFNPGTGVLQGTPTTRFPRSAFRVTARNRGGLDSVVVYIQVDDRPPSGLSYPNGGLMNLGQGNVIAPFVPTLEQTAPELVWDVSPALPFGLSMDTSTGVVTGAPALASESSVHTVTVSNSGGSALTYLEIVVLPVPPSNLQYPENSLALTHLQAITPLRPTVVFTVDEFTISPFLPYGLALDPRTGVILGVPALQFPQTNFTITASNAGGSTSFDLTLRVDYPPVINVLSLTYHRQDGTYILGNAMSNFVTSDPLRPATWPAGQDTFQLDPQTPLPSGLSFDPATGTISGVPTSLTPRRTLRVHRYGFLGVLHIEVIEPAPVRITYAELPVRRPRMSNLTAQPVRASALLPPRSTRAALEAPRAAVWSVYPEAVLTRSGLSIDPATGAIVGYAHTVMPLQRFTVVASTTGGRVSAEIEIEVYPREVSRVELNPNATRALVNVSSGDVIDLAPPEVDGDVVEYRIEPPLPSGLALNNVTGRIAGLVPNMTTTVFTLIAETGTGRELSSSFVIHGSQELNRTLTEERLETHVVETEDKTARSLAISAIAVVFSVLFVAILCFIVCRRRPSFTKEDDEFIYKEDEATFNKRLQLLKKRGTLGGHSSSAWDLEGAGGDDGSDAISEVSSDGSEELGRSPRTSRQPTFRRTASKRRMSSSSHSLRRLNSRRSSVGSRRSSIDLGRGVDVPSSDEDADEYGTTGGTWGAEGEDAPMPRPQGEQEYL